MLSNSPIFTIITVCFNSESTIAKTIESVLSQSFEDYEYILIDGKSTDGTVEIIKKYEPLFNGKMKWISESDNGVYDAMNKGIKLARGRMVSFLNSSDWYNENTLSSVLKYYRSDLDPVVIYGIINYFDITGKMLYVYGVHFNMLHTEMIAHPATFMSVDILRKLNGFDSNYRIAADYDLMLRTSKVKGIKFVYCGEILANFTEGGLSSNFFKTTLEVLKIKRNHGIISSRWYYYKAFRMRVLKIITVLFPG